MEPRYDPQQHEGQIYQQWEKSGAFSPSASGKPFTIIMPPPNANDPLHIGHAMFVALEDILIRYHRMKGDATLWLPGTDHAGIETQYVFEKKLNKEGKSRFNYDRQALYQMIWKYVQDNSNIAIDQIKKLGASCDWSRFKFTLDPKVVEIVYSNFLKLHQAGLVYRDLRLVQYCTHCGTAFSELEVKHVERTTPLYYLKYGPFTLTTVRPETKFGDTAVAVHPKDKRYQKYIGKEIEVEGLIGKFTMKVIADEAVDPKFGTGVLKVTPAHDPTDFEIWQRHASEMPEPKQVIDFAGKLTERAGKYQGLKVAKAREAVVKDLETAGLMVKVDPNYTHTIGVCYRCGTVLEPLPLPQFFIKVKSLTQTALNALRDNKVKVVGAGHDKILKHWLTNLRDWNISRQIVWGIRLPVWYDVDKYPDIRLAIITHSGEFDSGTISKLRKKYSLDEIRRGMQGIKVDTGVEFVVSPNSPGENFIQETDTFDTWFSSAQWPFATLMTNQPGDFDRFYPTSVIETGYDILPFWVMRMLMMGLFATAEAPFHVVYLHGLIRDERGQKMSKSKGNVINPLVMVDKYGTDALRMALVIRSTPGLDKGVGENDIRGMRNLTNKVWNAARFIMMNRQLAPQESSLASWSVSTPAKSDPAGFGRSSSDMTSEGSSENAASRDKEFQLKLQQVVKTVTRQIEEYRIGLAAETVYNEFWHWYCDQCIEQAKKNELSYPLLRHGLITFLKLLHPFVPFVTEAVWQQIKDTDSPLLINAKWPSK